MAKTYGNKAAQIAVLISNAGSGTNLQSIIDAVSAKIIHAQIAVVVSDTSDAYGLQRAKTHHLPTYVLKPHEDLIELLKNTYPVDYIALAGWKKIVTNETIAAFPNRILNIHPGLIPDVYEGKVLNPDGTHGLWNRGKFTDKAIKNFLDEKSTYAGSTIHFLTKRFDFGPVLGRCFEKILPEDTVTALYERLKVKENALYAQVLKDLSNSMKKSILIIGSGAREHALGWKLQQSSQVERIFFAPGNAGTAKIGENISIAVDDVERLIFFAKSNDIDLTVVGPELALAAGIVDAFTKENLAIFGPTQKAARLESSKIFSAQFNQSYGIAQPLFWVCESVVSAYSALEKVDWQKGIVIKADGLAAGKGVFLPKNFQEALDVVRKLMVERIFAKAGDRIIIQEKMVGTEVSLLFFCDGKTALPMVSAKDYKRVFDSDMGLNTGGMGAIAPNPQLTPELVEVVMQTIVEPLLSGMHKEGIPFAGVLYCGLMLTNDGPKVLEYNVRFGDPETQVILPLLRDDLFDILKSCIGGYLKSQPVKFSDEHAACVVLAAEGYPGKFAKDMRIYGLEKTSKVMIFHAGTYLNDKQIVTNGGRVLSVVKIGKSLQAATAAVYEAIGEHGIHFENMHYRHDIGDGTHKTVTETTTQTEPFEKIYRIEIHSTVSDMRTQVRTALLNKLGFTPIEVVLITDVYTIKKDLTDEEVIRIADNLTNPVTQTSRIIRHLSRKNEQEGKKFSWVIEIGYLPGVTDNIANTTKEIVADLCRKPFSQTDGVYSSQMTFINGNLTLSQIKEIAAYLYNPLIQRARIKSFADFLNDGGMEIEVSQVKLGQTTAPLKINLHISNEELIKLGREGILDPNTNTRRGPLALDLSYLQAIRKYFDEKGRSPTDVELESIAQTWSEHCKHTIFNDPIADIPYGLFNTYIKRATEEIRKRTNGKDFCASVFTDNSGGIFFDKNYVVSFKVETHNSPSALDPFGGAITGIVGVNRDALGFGLSAKPIANTYGFCLADPVDITVYYRDQEKTQPLLSSQRIFEGVVAGVNSGGNCSGIPTPQGFLYFDPRFRGKPLVFAGTVGLIPLTSGKTNLITKKARSGDLIVMVGGRVGLDGIHGATFSSESLNSGSPATAVQIGDPITQKKLSDLLIKEARDQDLYASITDNGAGGLSCSVAEMAKESDGCLVNLEKVPLKYPGLEPWQIWISESQERMTLAVPYDKWEQIKTLCDRRDVEATVIGTFTDTGKCVVQYNDEVVLDLDMEFLHNGLPPKPQEVSYPFVYYPEPQIPYEKDLTHTFVEIIGDLSLASFEKVSAQYDHEVQGQTVLKPLHGKGRINADVSVIRPILDSDQGVMLTQALYPGYSDIDTYHMAAASVDSAVRQIVSAGGNFAQTALLDNFCWCDSTNPERLGQLVRAAQACYDYATLYKTPFISGKDSMFNDFKGYDEQGNRVVISIPPTLLISAISIVPDTKKVVSIDFKAAGDQIYVLGETFDEIGGSAFVSWYSKKSGHLTPGNTVPKVNASINIRMYERVSAAIKNGLVASSISIGRGGLAAAIAKASMAGEYGVEVHLIQLPGIQTRSDYALFSESQGRILVSVAPEHTLKFEKLFTELPIAAIGKTTADPSILIYARNNEMLVNTNIMSTAASYKKQFGFLKKQPPKALVLTGYGINCEEESAFALEKAGGASEVVHINDVIDGHKALSDYEIVVFPGGFAFADDTGAGNAFALKLKNNIWEKIQEYIAADHLVIGVCNGFQILVNLGLLPALNKNYGQREVALLHNTSAVYSVRWVDLEIPQNHSPWLNNINHLSVPIAHGEGRFYAPPETVTHLKQKKMIAAYYVKGDICTFQSLPANPNGSVENIAAITDETGRILGIMPHPERAIRFTHLPHWTALKDALMRQGQPIPEDGPGLSLFRNAINYFA